MHNAPERTARVVAHMTPEQRALVAKAAYQKGLSVSQYGVLRLLEAAKSDLAPEVAVAS